MKIYSSLFDASSLLLDRAEELLAMRRLEPALRAFDCAQAHGADLARCFAGRWQAHALSGNLAAAWAESAAIRSQGLDVDHCLWRGEEIAGKRVIVRCLHGYGDAVQLLRYAPQLNALASRVVWEVAPALAEVARCFVGADRVVPWGSRHSWARSWDVQIEVTELPCLFETDIADLPLAIDYLRLPAGVMASTLRSIGPKTAPRVGLVWASGAWNPSRSIPLRAFRHILRTGGCEFWNLQGGTARQDPRYLNCATLRDGKLCSDGILQLAAVVSQLDLVITVDTLAAHLAGALGVPAWVLLQFAADWRWMTDRNDSPWYPSLCLFRQQTPGDWASVLYKLEAKFHQWLSSQAGRLAA